MGGPQNAGFIMEKKKNNFRKPPNGFVFQSTPYCLALQGSSVWFLEGDAAKNMEFHVSHISKQFERTGHHLAIIIKYPDISRYFRMICFLGWLNAHGWLDPQDPVGTLYRTLSKSKYGFPIPVPASYQLISAFVLVQFANLLGLNMLNHHFC